MIRSTLAVTALLLLTACGDGQPLFDDPTTETPSTGGTDGTGGTGGIGTDGATPPLPGTVSPSAQTGIFRYEQAESGGGGLVQDVRYNAANDTFTVDGIGFDGNNVYQRLSGPLRTVGTARVFGAASAVRDPLTGKPVSQVTPYRALYGVSKNRTAGEPTTSYAIVRTGGYVDYGFGGFVYQRQGGVKLPSTGQATFKGDYSGVRVFDARGGLEYTTGDMSVQIDFDDFDANDAVRGRLTNRTAIDQNGTAIPLSRDEGSLQLPDVFWVIQAGAPSLNSNGELTGSLQSAILNADGALETYETGKFYGVVAGDATTLPGGEIAGVVVLESADPRYEGVNVQETGGVILYR